MKDNKIWKILLNWDLLIANIVLVVLILSTFGGVIFRYILNNPIDWMEEVQMMAIVWVVFLGAGAAFREGGHVAVEIIVELFTKSVQKLIRVLTGILVIAVLAALCYLSAQYVEVAYFSGRCSGILRVPYYQVYGIIPVSCAWMILSYLYGEFHLKKDEEEQK